MENTLFTGSQLSKSEALDGATTLRSMGASAMPAHICSQTFGGHGKPSCLGACSGELECSRLSPHDRLLLYQFGMDEDHHVTTNFIEIARDGEQLTFYIFVEALGGYQAVVRRSLSHRHMKLFLKTNRRFAGYYDRIRFMIYDPEHHISHEQLSIHWYDLPETQHIESVGVALTLATGSNDCGKLQSEPVGFDHFMAYGEWDVPEKLKDNFEWNSGKIGTIPGLSIVSHHSEYYRSPTTVDLRLSKEYIHLCL